MADLCSICHTEKEDDLCPNCPRFYKNPFWEKEYKKRVQHYKYNLEVRFGDQFIWALDSEQVKEMVRCELVVMTLDQRIGNDILDKLTKDDLSLLKESRSSLFTYRKNLMITMEQRRKLDPIVVEKDAKEQMKALFQKANQ